MYRKFVRYLFNYNKIIEMSQTCAIFWGTRALMITILGTIVGLGIFSIQISTNPQISAQHTPLIIILSSDNTSKNNSNDILNAKHINGDKH